MDHWSEKIAGLKGLEPQARTLVDDLKPFSLPQGARLFSPGQRAEGFLLLTHGRVDVRIAAETGREISLYKVEPGHTCVQTTLCLLGGQAYSAEGIAMTPLQAVLVPVGRFRELMAVSEVFRSFVFEAFGSRVSDIVHLLESVAFLKIDQRLAGVLLQEADAACIVRTTHQELAVQIGSAREVVSRQLERMRAKGLVKLDRGQVEIVDLAGLQRISGSM